MDINFNLTSFNSSKRRSAEKLDREWSLFAENLREMFEEVIKGDTYRNSSIAITIAVLQSNGSLKSTLINTVSLALLDAGIEMKEILTSASAGYVPSFSDQPLADLSFLEENMNRPQVVVAITANSKKIVFLETANAKLQFNRMQDMTQLALDSAEIVAKRFTAFLNKFYREQVLLQS